jgi:undecaprenyl-diphosphatase|tara:strand:+ start:476 stop:1102 length:627 start_codon:yes stop_codon:yes gene_type:complete
MKKSVFIVGILIASISAFMAFLYDFELVNFISTLRNMSFDYVFLSVTFASNTFIVFFFLTTLFLWKEHKRRWIFPLWFATLFSAVTSYLLKIIIARPRPFQKGVPVLQIAFHFMKDNFLEWNFSFPSFQAMLVFSALPLISKEFKKFRWIWVVFASLVALSRVYFGVHYLSDVLIGSIIGYVIGYAMVVIEEKHGFGLKLMRKFRISK